MLADTTIYNGEYVVVGYIPNSDVITNGTITLKAYIDDDSIAISDTYDGSESYEMGTTNNWVEGYLDNWYKKNLTAYANYLDSATVYCNDRSISDLGGWNPSGTNLTGYLQFYQ